jgi:DNA invertase Pin-like site-specific DNA recombinase
VKATEPNVPRSLAVVVLVASVSLLRVRLTCAQQGPKKLGPKELKTIRALLSNEVPVQDIAAQFGVNRSTLYRNMTPSTP